MKVICKKHYSDVNNFFDHKEYECYHEKGKEDLKVKWIKDELGRWRCITPNSRSAHLTSTGGQDVFGKPITHSIGFFMIIDHSPSKEIPFGENK